MKKNLFTIGLLAASLSASAQVSYVGDAATMYLSQNALVYSGGDLSVAGKGTVENHGNYMIDNGGFYTAQTDGSNFTLQLDDTSNFAQYGQLWINNPSQSQLTGTLTKQYSDTYHGMYEQTALPFVNKLFGSLNNEIKNASGNPVFIDTRFIGGKASAQNILGWNNKVVRQDLFTLESSTTDPTQYYVLGANNLPTNYFPTTISLIKGIPSASGISKTLSGAGAGIDFGANGTGLNYYRQRYNTYIFDPWDTSSSYNWTGNYGKNIYEFGNPYFTNLDLTLLDSTTKSAIKGIRYSVSGSSTNLTNTSASEKYMNFTSSGQQVGDVAAIIKPMQEFEIKLINETVTPVINFDNLRTFSNTPSSQNYTNTGTTAKSASAVAVRNAAVASATNSSSVKQLDVIALDANKNEIARTYYAVYADGHSGAYNGYTVQAAATSTDIIGTFEEMAQGGIDTNLVNTYWLYINEANENDFKGKRVPLALFSNNIAYLKFTIRENMQKIPAQTSAVSTGESFYVNTGDTPTELTQDLVIPVPASAVNKNDGIGLYYGKPISTSSLSTVSVSQRPSATFVAWDDSAKDFKIVFDPTWKSADIQIFDLAGRLVSFENKVSTDTSHILNVPVAQGSYIVHAKSESGALFVQKILKN